MAFGVVYCVWHMAWFVACGLVPVCDVWHLPFHVVFSILDGMWRVVFCKACGFWHLAWHVVCGFWLGIWHSRWCVAFGIVCGV